MSKVARVIQLPEIQSAIDEISTLAELQDLMKEALFPGTSKLPARKAIVIIEVLTV